MDLVGDNPTGQVKGDCIQGLDFLIPLPSPWMLKDHLSFLIPLAWEHKEENGDTAGFDCFLNSPLPNIENTQFYFITLML